MHTLADRLAMVGGRSGLSIREAAQRANLSFGYLSRLLSGEKDSPTLDALVALAAIYRTTPEFLREGDPAVDLWSDLSRDPQFRMAGTQAPATRAELVIQFAQMKYPGHLRRDDLAGFIKRPLEPVDDDLLVKLAEITGVPLAWLRIGHFAFIPQDVLGTWPDLMAFLDEYGKRRSAPGYVDGAGQNSEKASAL